MTAPLPVIQVITHLPLGGAQRVALTLAERLDRSRFQVHVISGPKGDWLSRARSIPECTFHEAGHLLRELSARHDARVVPELARLFAAIRRAAPSGQALVHTHAPKAGVAGRIAARLTGCLSLHTLHGLPFYPQQKPLRRRMYQAFEQVGYWMGDQLVSVSQTNLNEVVFMRRWATLDKARLIYPCVDMERLKPREGARRLLPRFGIQPAHFVIGMVASLKPPKDPLGFIAAAARLVHSDEQKYANVRFVIAGDGELRPQVEQALQAGDLQDRTTLLGWFDPIEELYPELDLLALPTFSEGLPLALVEARACGVPVVACAVGGVAEIVSNGETGLLVPPADTEALCAAMRRIVDDPGLRAGLSARGRRGLEAFHPETMVRAYEALYDEMARRMNKQGT